MMNLKLVEGALGMLARSIPPAEYAKALIVLGELAAALKSIDARAKAIDDGVARCVRHLDGLDARVTMLEIAAAVDSPAFGAAQSEQAMWMVPGSIERALAPSKGDGDGR